MGPSEVLEQPQWPDGKVAGPGKKEVSSCLLSRRVVCRTLGEVDYEQDVADRAGRRGVVY